MKKFHGLRLISLVSILTFSLVFIVFSFVQGQVTTKAKPDKPPGQDKGPEYVWSVVILQGQFSIQGGVGAAWYSGDGGSGWLYDCSEPNIYFHMRLVGPMQDQYRTGSRFEIYYPDPTQNETLYQVDFTDNIPIWDAYFIEEPPSFIDPDLNPDFAYQPGRFPVCGEPGINCSAPTAMFDFMKNWDHPHQGYEKVLIEFYTGWFNSIDEADFSQWALNDPKNIYLGVGIEPLGVEGPYSPSEYNGIGFHHGYGEVYGYIEKIAATDANTDIWKLVFGKDIHGNDYVDEGDLNVIFDEHYWDYYLKQFNKNRAKEEINIFYPTYGVCDMQFELLFIRTKIE